MVKVSARRLERRKARYQLTFTRREYWQSYSLLVTIPLWPRVSHADTHSLSQDQKKLAELSLARQIDFLDILRLAYKPSATSNENSLSSCTSTIFRLSSK